MCGTMGARGENLDACNACDLAFGGLALAFWGALGPLGALLGQGRMVALQECGRTKVGIVDSWVTGRPLSAVVAPGRATRAVLKRRMPAVEPGTLATQRLSNLCRVSSPLNQAPRDWEWAPLQTQGSMGSMGCCATQLRQRTLSVHCAVVYYVLGMYGMDASASACALAKSLPPSIPPFSTKNAPIAS